MRIELTDVDSAWLPPGPHQNMGAESACVEACEQLIFVSPGCTVWMPAYVGR